MTRSGGDQGPGGPRTLADWYRQGLALAADGVALRLGTEEWTYGELHGIALRLAGAIRSRLDDRAAPVGVLAARGIESYVGILAASYAGVPVVPLSPGFPRDRTVDMARAAGIRVLVADRRGVAALPGLLAAIPGLATVVTEPGLRGCAPGVSLADDATALPAPIAAEPEDVAYVLFTSGSTGRPKGVPVTHDNMSHFLRVNLDRYGLRRTDVCSQTFDTTFDLAMFDLFVTWAAGATLVSVPPQAFVALPDFVRRNGLTVWFSVPSAISLARRRGSLAPGALTGLRWSLFCGEPLLASDAEDWLAAAPGCVLENLYGPTELTIACSAYRWDPDSSPSTCVNGVVPIGHLYPTLEAVLLDSAGRVCDNEGELCVAGAQLFPGYLDRADDRDRLLTMAGQRWYRTGDLVRRCADGGFAFLGRVDHQIKIRGYRVELGELEWRLRDVPGIVEAVVVPVDDAATRRLFAWYTGEPAAAQDARDQLKAAVPEFMVPHWFRHVDQLPQTANGKVDRVSLTGWAQQAVAQPADRPG